MQRKIGGMVKNIKWGNLRFSIITWPGNMILMVGSVALMVDLNEWPKLPQYRHEAGLPRTLDLGIVAISTLPFNI